ncbi:MAG: hypothetical protein NC548_30215 [Lachnospiraceae bacterium]|nr:hypothetical protein [Lachnospiraceae bacterium]
MKRNYIYIDDDKLENSQAKVRGFNNENLTINAQQHKGTWESQLSYIQDSADEIDGLILDLGLCDLPNENNKRADFRGTSIAQEIRTRQKEGIILSFPIILFSANDKLANLLETTGLDLFDLCIDKESICIEIFDELSSKLYALAEGYKIITENNHTTPDNLKNILQVDIKKIDERFIAELRNLINNPTHTIASFIINELLERQGLLIDRLTLAARLGVNIEQSEDWQQLLTRLDFAKYKGVFSEGWERWWMSSVESWWNDEISNDSLRTMSAQKRVSLLIEKLNLSGFSVAKPIQRAESDAFWTICQGYKTPIDTIDGLLIDGQDNLYPWQEPEYVSIDAALRRKNIAKWKKVSIIERHFLEGLKYSHTTK